MAIQSLTIEELTGLLRAARTHSERDWLMILVGFWHGCRASELCALTSQNVKDEYITIRRLKGRKRKEKVIPRITKHRLIQHENALLDERKAVIDLALKTPRNQTLFKIQRRQLNNVIQRHGEAAGLPAHKRHAHVLRHTIATYLLPRIGLPALQQYIGWWEESTALKYTKVTEESAVEAVEQAVEGLIV